MRHPTGGVIYGGYANGYYTSRQNKVKKILGQIWRFQAEKREIVDKNASP